MRLPLFIVTLLSLLSAQTFADSSHQFSVNVGTTQLGYEAQREAKFYSLGGTAYFEAVKKSTALPYARTAFYSRVGSVSLSAIQEKHKDLNRISGWRILESIDAKSYSTEVFIAKKNLPIWGRLNYTHFDKTDFQFNVGTSVSPNTNSIKSLTLGTYIDNDFSIHTSYKKQNSSTYGIGLRKLFKINNLSFIETYINYSITDSNESSLDSFILQNLSKYSTLKNKKGLINITYFPTPQTGFGISYQLTDYKNTYAKKDHYYSANIEHYFNNNFKTKLGYTIQDTKNINNIDDYKAISLSLGFDF